MMEMPDLFSKFELPSAVKNGTKWMLKDKYKHLVPDTYPCRTAVLKETHKITGIMIVEFGEEDPIDDLFLPEKFREMFSPIQQQ